MHDIVLVSYAQPKPDAVEELTPLLDAFKVRGMKARVAAWDDPTVDWNRTGVSVLRSPWNYYRFRGAFLQWSRRVPRLFNAPDVIAWNSHKGYLRELEAKNVPIVPTEWLEREVPLDEVLTRRGWEEAVVKPAISAGAFRTQRFAKGAAPQALLREILSEGTAMVQPYFSSVETSGERSLIYFGGELSHSARRHPPLTSGLQGAQSALASQEERVFADRVLAAAVGPLLYARVDMARDETGSLKLMELELIEPSFFLDTDVGAADRFVDAVVKVAP